MNRVSYSSRTASARACVLALKEFPRVNAFIEGDDVVYHNYVHLGIAVSTDRGLAVPVMRHAEQLSFARIEQEVKRLAQATRDGKLVYMMERRDIETKSAEAIADQLTLAFDKHCAATANVTN